MKFKEMKKKCLYIIIYKYNNFIEKMYMILYIEYCMMYRNFTFCRKNNAKVIFFIFLNYFFILCSYILDVSGELQQT